MTSATTYLIRRFPHPHITIGSKIDAQKFSLLSLSLLPSRGALAQKRRKQSRGQGTRLWISEEFLAPLVCGPSAYAARPMI